jgi:hypothetical protein
MSHIPVALFVYNRADLVRRTVEALLADGIPKLIVFSDGPKDSNDAKHVSEVRAYIGSLDSDIVELRAREQNRGLGRSVLAGVSEILDAHEMAIVFEDDLVCVPGTYRYLSAALLHYRSMPEVMSVTGWTHPRVTPETAHAMPYFDGKGECWAWGTWRRAWVGMDRPALEIMEDCRRTGLDVERYGYDMPIMAREAAERNLWAIGWWYHHIRHGGLCLRPPRSLVEHTGWDPRGTTTVPKMRENWLNPPLGPAPMPPSHWPAPREHSECPALWRKAALETRLD